MIIILVVWAGAHLLYEAVIAPSIRQKLQFRLFGLRDELRSLKYERPETLPDEVCRYLEEYLNNAIALIPALSIPRVVAAQALIEKDEGLRQKIARRKRALDECPLEEVRRIQQECRKTGWHALIVNHGALLAFLLPSFAALRVVARFSMWLTRLTVRPALAKVSQWSEMLGTLILVPEKERDSVVPTGSAVAT